MENKDLQEQLAKMRREAEERDARRIAELNGLSYLGQINISVDLDALGIIEKKIAVEAKIAAIEIKDKKIVVVVYDPNFSRTKEVIKKLISNGFNIVEYVISESSFNYVISYYRFVNHKRVQIIGSVKINSDKNEIDTDSLDNLDKVKEEILRQVASGDITNLFQIILLGAIVNKASDIHLEPSKDKAKIRYRIDGMLNDVIDELRLNVYKLIVSRIKLLSNLKLNIRDETQGGRFTINLSKKDIEVRVAIAPSEFGEVIVMRLLDPNAINIKLSELGLRDDDLEIIKDELDSPNGMILNTGPTGSGKTTTLYAFLRYKNNSMIKIITIEDPIEYHLEGIEQTQVDKEAGYTFASGLRSLMRQDPDVILVGEIRDMETAKIAVQAALTGHLVFSTVHANNSSAAIPRLLDLSVKSASLAPALNLIIAQRLVRKLCENCKEEVKISEKTKEDITKYVEKFPDRIDKKKLLDNIKIYKPRGCKKCVDTGYKGRIAVFELLKINKNIQELIIKKVGQIEIEKEIEKTDFVNMQQDGVIKVISGVTTLNEVKRIVGKIDLKIKEIEDYQNNESIETASLDNGKNGI